MNKKVLITISAVSSLGILGALTLKFLYSKKKINLNDLSKLEIKINEQIKLLKVPELKKSFDQVLTYDW